MPPTQPVVMPEDLVPGEYELVDEIDRLLIHETNSTTSPSIGAYTKADKVIKVFEVYPEDKAGIVWGRTSSNKYGKQRRIGLRVNMNYKVRLTKAYQPAELADNERLAKIEGFLQVKFGYVP